MLVPNGWYPPLVWRLARAWRMAKSSAIPKKWMLDGVSIANLQIQNRVPSRFSRPLSHDDRVTTALNHEFARNAVSANHDVAIVQFALPYGPPVASAAATNGLRYVVYLRGDDVWIWPRESERRHQAFVSTLQSASLVLATSEALLHEAKRICGGVLPPHTALPNGIDLVRYRPNRRDVDRHAIRAELGIPPNDLVVLCVAAPIERKGWLDLLDALDVVTGSGMRVTLLAALSKAESELDVVREAVTRAATVKVVALENVSELRMPSVYHAADVFCLPSHGEGMSNAVMEAMASGLPVITTAVGGHAEIIHSGVEGILVQPQDIRGLAAALHRVLNDGDERERLGEAARVRAERIGDARRAARLLGDMLWQLLHNNEPDVASVDAYGRFSATTSPVNSCDLS